MSPISPAAFSGRHPRTTASGRTDSPSGTHVVRYGVTAIYQEFVRASLNGWHVQVAEGLAIVTDECIELAARAGRGLRTQNLQG